MRPAGNESKGAMKLRVDFKKKPAGDLIWIMLSVVESEQSCSMLT